MQNVSKKEVRKLIGKSIYAVRSDGSVVTGKLVRIHRNKLILEPIGKDKGKKVQTSFFFFPLLLLGVLAVGALCSCGCGAKAGSCYNQCGGGGYGGGFGGGYGGGYGGGGYNGFNNGYQGGGYYSGF